MTCRGATAIPGPLPPGWPWSAPETGHERLRLLLAYDGSAFRGFAENAGVRTVGGDLRTALGGSSVFALVLAVAGRTDAGVHARWQVVSVDVPEGSVEPAGRCGGSVNSMLAPHVVAREVALAPDDFDARFSAKWRRYRYRLLTIRGARPVPRGHHLVDASRPRPPPNGRRRARSGRRARLQLRSAAGHGTDRMPRWCVSVTDARWSQELGDDPRVLTFEITATAFCHQMVRSIVGTLVEIGRGRRPVSTVTEALVGRDRSLAGQLAPPEGLFLWEVGY